MSNHDRSMALFAMYHDHMLLCDYLKEVTSGHDVVLLRDDDPAEYASFITTALIAYQHKDMFEKRFAHFSHASTQNELIKRVVSKLFQTSSWPAHVLAYGYRKTRTFSNNGLRGLQGLDCYYPNTLHSYVTGRPWCMLLERVGDDVMMHLMLYGAVFIPVHNGSWLQVCGPAAPAAMRASILAVPPGSNKLAKRAVESDDCHGGQPTKRHKMDDSRALQGTDVVVADAGILASEEQVRPLNRLRRKRMSSWLRRKLRKRKGGMPGSESISSELRSSQAAHSHSEDSQTRRLVAERRAGKQESRRALGAADDDDDRMPGVEGFMEEPPGPELQTLAADGGDPTATIPGAAEATDGDKLCGGFQCKGVPRYRSAYVIDRSRMMYRAGMGDLSFSKTHVLSRARVSKRGADVVIRHVFGLCTRPVKHHVVLPRRLVALRKPFVKMLGRARQCHMRSMLNRHCPPPPVDSTCDGAGTASDRRNATPCVTDEPLSPAMDLWPAVSQDSFVQSLPLTPDRLRRTSAEQPEPSLHAGVTPLRQVQTMPLDRTVEPADVVRKTKSLPERLRKKDSSRARRDDDTGWGALLARSVPYSNVVRFVHGVLGHVVPDEMWGGEANRRVIYDKIGAFVRYGRYETVAMATIMHGVKVGSFRWVAGLAHEMQQQMVGAWLLWVFDELVIPVLQAFFYVTEGSTSRHNLLYYRKQDWYAVWSRGMASLTTSVLRRVTKEKLPHLLDTRTLTFSYSRLLPKPDGVRLIVNMSRRIGQTGDVELGMMRPGTSINACLANVFHVLNFEKERKMRDVDSATIMHTNSVYERLKPLVARWRAIPKQRRPRLHVVTADVRGAFDNINQEQLLRLVRKLVTEDDYWVRKYAAITLSHGRLRRQFRRQATLTEDDRSAIEFGRDLSSGLRKALIVDQVVYSYEERESLLKLLIEHVTANLVKIQGQLYVQRQGIPQGSVLSSLLCTLLLDKLDTQRLMPLLASAEHHMLVRLVDDYLMVTDNPETAEHFLAELSQGHPEYGVTINQHKTQTSFPLPPGCEGTSVTSGEDGQWIPWCGILLCARTMNVRTDYSRYAQAPIRDTITVAHNGGPGHNLTYRAKTFLHYKTHPLFLDCGLNTTFNVCVNIYQNGVMGAMRLIAYVAAMEVQPRVAFLTAVVEECVASYYGSLRGSINGPAGARHQARFDLNKANVTWLVAAGMHRAFARKQSRHGDVVGMLERIMAAHTDSAQSTRQALLVKATAPRHNRVFDGMKY